MPENEVIHETTLNVTPVAANVRVETIIVQEGSWEEYVGAVGEAEVVYKRSSVHTSGFSPKPLGIVFFCGGNWCIAATGHERYQFPGGANEVTHNDALWFLAQAHQIVTSDSPRYRGQPT